MENKKIPFPKTFFTIIASAIIGIVLSGLTTFAAPPTNKYAPGETLTPNCLPGSTNCTIVPLAASGANTDITSLSSLATTTWSTGAAITATSYQIGRDADATNQLHFNVPTGAGYEWSVNDVGFATWSPTQLLFTQATATTGNPLAFSVTGANNTTLTNSDQVEAQFDFVQTKQFTGAAGATTIDNAYGLGIGGSTYQTAGAGALTITNGATFYISKAPTTTAGGGGTTITNSLALLVDEGKVRFDGGGTSGQASAAGGLLEMKASTINGNNASGTIAIGTPVSLGITTYTNNNATLTMSNAASLYIAGIPVASTNVAFTQAPYALWVDAGNIRLDGTILQGVTTSTAAGYFIEQSTNQATSYLARSVNTNTAAQHLFQMVNDSSKDVQFGIYGSLHSNTWGRNNGFFFTTNDMLFSTDDTVANGGTHSIKFGTGGYDMSTQVRLELDSKGNIFSTPGIATSGVQTYFKTTAPASTGQTTATEVPGVDFDLDATKTWANGAITTQREFVIRAPTYNMTSVDAGNIITTAATLAVTGAPIDAGANIAITNPYALWVQAGVTSLSGGTRFNNSTTIPAGNIEPHQFFNTAAANTGVVMSLANTSTAGYASINFYNTDTISLVGGFGFGNSTSYFASKVFFSANSREMIFTTNNATTHLSLATISGNAAFSAGVSSSGAQTYFKITAPASTGQTAATEVVGLDFDLDATKTWATGAGPLATQREVLFRAPTYDAAGGPLVITNAATVAITAAPIDGGANISFTNSHALLVQAGASTFKGRVNETQGVDVASVNNLELGADGNVFEITGTTQINLILNTNWQNGSKVTLVFNESVTVAHAQATSGSNITILLAGAVNFTATANDTLTLVLSETTTGGQAWREEARSVI